MKRTMMRVLRWMGFFKEDPLEAMTVEEFEQMEEILSAAVRWEQVRRARKDNGK